MVPIKVLEELFLQDAQVWARRGMTVAEAIVFLADEVIPSHKQLGRDRVVESLEGRVELLRWGLGEVM